MDGHIRDITWLDCQQMAFITTVRKPAHPALGVDVAANRQECEAQEPLSNRGPNSEKLVPRAGIEPARCNAPRDFKSLASTNFATPAEQASWGRSIVLSMFRLTGDRHKSPTLESKKNPSIRDGIFKNNWRRHPGSNWGITILQTVALPLGYAASE